MSNRERVDRGLVALAEALVPFVDRHLGPVAPGGDWLGLLRARDEQNYGTSKLGTNKSDPHALLRAILDNWNGVFSKKLPAAARNYVGELRDVRNRLAHHEPFNGDDTLRALDTMQRLATQVGAPQVADRVRRMRLELLRQTYEEETRRAQRTVAQTPAAADLKPWREVIAPHRDVAEGNFSASEYAVNLAYVTSGEGEPEYVDPVEFFRRTYLTEGLRDLLVKAARRLAGDDNAPPIINLQTTFGGGKTHSLLALYHLFGGRPLTDFPQEVQELLGGQEARAVAQPVTRAVLVGTELAPAEPARKPDGTLVRTLWGELAYALGDAAAYARIARADETATNPGDALRQIIADAAPCLILVDEWVAYARQLFGTEHPLPAGTFETHFTFAQTLTEAVQAVPGALLVVSIPASEDRAGAVAVDTEIGGLSGREALERLRHVIGRIADHWRPAGAEESFEIVRRRLFQTPDAAALGEIAAVARRFGDYYRDNRAELPSESVDPAYERRIRAAYPIHPELFDRLYQDWSTLERFQRTRGVLRLMSKVINHLWLSGDAAPLIMPGSVPLDVADVRTELVHYLEDSWGPVLDTDVDGTASTPGRIDSERPLYGKRSLARRVARTVFMGSAATLRSAHKGVEEQRIRLGVAVPGEAMGAIHDALGLLANRASYLYSDADRYWYDTQPSVARIARDHAERLREQPATVHAEIIRRLRSHEDRRHRGAFAAVHTAPQGSGEVADTEEVRLVLLHPEQTYLPKQADCAALRFAHQLVETCGVSQRENRNLIVALAPDGRRLDDLMAAARDYLAWDDIAGRVRELNLSPAQAKQAEERRDQARNVVGQRILETYTWVLVPQQSDGARPWEWEVLRTEAGDWLAERASRRLVASGNLVERYGPNRLGLELRDPAKLGRAWSERGHLSVGELWRYHRQYPYLPRLRDRTVLDRCIESGVSLISWDQDGFAFADGYDQAGDRYLGLVLPSTDAAVQSRDSLLLVRPDLALRQAEHDQARAAERLRALSGQPPVVATTQTTTPAAAQLPATPARPAPPLPRRFFGAADIDVAEAGRRISEVIDDVIGELARAGGQIRLTVEIHADHDSGFPDDVRNTVTENTRALRFRTADFE